MTIFGKLAISPDEGPYRKNEVAKLYIRGLITTVGIFVEIR